jgi:hypothetical protein
MIHTFHQSSKGNGMARQPVIESRLCISTSSLLFLGLQALLTIQPRVTLNNRNGLLRSEIQDGTRRKQTQKGSSEPDQEVPP